jgi:hypothetical protein
VSHGDRRDAITATITTKLIAVSLLRPSELVISPSVKRVTDWGGAVCFHVRHASAAL